MFVKFFAIFNFFLTSIVGEKSTADIRLKFKIVFELLPKNKIDFVK